MKSVWWVTASTLLAIIQCQVLDKVGEDTEFEERSIELPVSKLEQLKYQLDQEEEPRRRTFPGAGRLTNYVRGVLNNVRGLLQPPVASILRTPWRRRSQNNKTNKEYSSTSNKDQNQAFSANTTTQTCEHKQHLPKIALSKPTKQQQLQLSFSFLGCLRFHPPAFPGTGTGLPCS